MWAAAHQNSLAKPMALIERIRKAINLTDSTTGCVIEAGKHNWQNLIRQCHDPLFEKRYNEWSGRQWIDLRFPGLDIGTAYNSGNPGAIDYSHIGAWEQLCFWFVYDEYDTKIKIWAFIGSLGKIVDCINELGWVDSTIADQKKQRWIVTYRDTVWYCGKQGS